MDVHVRPGRMPGAGETEQAHDLGVILQLLHGVAQRCLAPRGEDAELARVHAEADAGSTGDPAGPSQLRLDDPAHRRLFIGPSANLVRIGGEHAALDAQQPFQRRSARDPGELGLKCRHVVPDDLEQTLQHGRPLAPAECRHRGRGQVHAPQFRPVAIGRDEAAAETEAGMDLEAHG